ncbi:hypothetical protein GCM10010492_71620 [Saccharothrix mutabilis subsp. mutabilis]|uniref:Uncharacterized protein n=1 Tax=Saccharothrix mutabilis subsp. mutabilis TaxID=66855 RepID=A0ABN0USP0_9PSEU
MPSVILREGICECGRNNITDEYVTVRCPAAQGAEKACQLRDKDRGTDHSRFYKNGFDPGVGVVRAATNG